VFGTQGTLESFAHSKSKLNEVTGAQTADGVHHVAVLTIVAAGGWTPTLVPELDGLCETTGGSGWFGFGRIPRECKYLLHVTSLFQLRSLVKGEVMRKMPTLSQGQSRYSCVLPKVVCAGFRLSPFSIVNMFGSPRLVRHQYFKAAGKE
jgi:hypothetical protein